jgi:hypothetical protein
VKDFVPEQVSKYLRCIVGSDSTGGIIYTDTPSEPIMRSVYDASRVKLGEAHEELMILFSSAAAWIQRATFAGGGPINWDRSAECPATRKPFAYWSAAIRVIRKKQLTGALRVGENGEDFFRLIMTIAMDAEAASQLTVDPAQSYLPPELYLVNLGRFLERLSGKRFVYDSKYWPTASWVNVTHFMQMGGPFDEDEPLTRRHLVELFSRGAAGIGNRKQRGWAIVIPAYHCGIERPGPREKLDISKLCFVLIDVKIDPNEKITQAYARIDQEETQKTIADDLNVPSLYLHFNLAQPPSSDIRKYGWKKGNMTFMCLGGGEDRFPVFKEFQDYATRQSLLGLLGLCGAVLGQGDKPPRRGPEASRDMCFRLGLQFMHGDE